MAHVTDPREDIVLELRPTCEHCNKLLPPDSPEARICSYECTFCATCVEGVLGNVCPNDQTSVTLPVGMSYTAPTMSNFLPS